MRIVIKATRPAYCLMLLSLVGAPVARAQSGACCLGDGTCADTNLAGCDLGLGDFLGEGSTCANAVCLGACCFEDETCAEGSRDSCDALAGTFQGPETTCAEHCAMKLPTVFNYQGQLKQAGVPLSGTVDLEFSLWTTTIGGDQVGETLSVENVSVTGGLLSVPLDFGSSVFNGNARWLEIAVRSPAGGGAFSTLSPRQLITATPYALHTRGLLVNDAGGVSIGSTFYGSFPLTVEGSGERTIYASNSRASGSGVGVYGFASASSGNTKGIYGLSHSPSGIGVDGASASQTGTTYGVRGTSSSTAGTGVYGVAAGPTGLDVNYGVRGLNVGPLGFGVYCEGRFGVKHTSVATVTPWPVRIENDTHAQHQAGMRVSDDGFFDATNDALDASPNFARLNNTGNWTVVSDRRIKRDIQPLSGTLDKALALEPVSFRFKNDDATSDDTQIGFIAQDVRRQFPSLVTDGELLTLNYAGMSVVAISALQELHEVIKQENREITAQRQQITDLTARLERMEAMITKLAANKAGGFE